MLIFIPLIMACLFHLVQIHTSYASYTKAKTNVLCAVVINKIICHADCTLIVTLKRDFAQLVAIVLKDLPHLE